MLKLYKNYLQASTHFSQMDLDQGILILSLLSVTICSSKFNYTASKKASYLYKVAHFLSFHAISFCFCLYLTVLISFLFCNIFT